MIRARFIVPSKDYRPMIWPIKHPYWCTGSGVSGATLVAYVGSIEELKTLWPDAIDIDDSRHVGHYEFSDRFPKPDWFVEPPRDYMEELKYEYGESESAHYIIEDMWKELKELRFRMESLDK